MLRLCLFVVATLAVVSCFGFEHTRMFGDQEWILTPHGFRPKECVHAVGHGATVNHTEAGIKITHVDGRVEAFRPCRAVFNPEAAEGSENRRRGGEEPLPNGWSAYVHWFSGASTPVTKYLGDWKVPGPPQQQQVQTLFLFTGLQTGFMDYTDKSKPVVPAGVSIIQPVLQWGQSAAGGGSYWTIASWFVGAGHSVYSDLKQVASGDSLFGNMTLLGTQDHWWINTVDTTTGVQTGVNVHSQASEPYAFVTLEVYGVESCTDYPNGNTVFDRLQLASINQPLTPSWAATATPACSEAAKIESPQKINIKW